MGDYASSVRISRSTQSQAGERMEPLSHRVLLPLPSLVARSFVDATWIVRADGVGDRTDCGLAAVAPGSDGGQDGQLRMRS